MGEKRGVPIGTPLFASSIAVGGLLREFRQKPYSGTGCTRGSDIETNAGNPGFFPSCLIVRPGLDKPGHPDTQAGSLARSGVRR